MKPLTAALNPHRRPGPAFVRKRSGPFQREVVLDRKRVYILPSRYGLAYALLLLILLLGSINYDKSLGYALTFLLFGLGNVLLLACWRNLAGLTIRAEGSAPVFAGQPARFHIRLTNPDATPRRAIGLHAEQQPDEAAMPARYTDIDAGADSLLGFTRPTHRRGWLPSGRIRLFTDYPGGLFTAWTWVEFSMQALVYPAPAKETTTPAAQAGASGRRQTTADGNDDFSHLRNWQKGDSWRRIDWKAVARRDDLLSRQFIGEQAGDNCWIDWWRLADNDDEQRLSRMCRMLLDAEAAGHRYGLRLPGARIEPSSGQAHLHHCLKQLALYGAPPKQDTPKTGHPQNRTPIE